MALFDSESSDGENDEYTETNVLLGYPSRETSDDIVNHLGGRPQWIDARHPPSASLIRCKLCNNFMVLLLQLNGCLPEHFPGHVRRIYLWICREKKCTRKDGSIRVFRGIQILGDIDDTVGGGKKNKYKNEENIFTNDTNSESRSAPAAATTTIEEEKNVRKKLRGNNLGEVLFASKDLSDHKDSRNPFSTTFKTTVISSNPFHSDSKSLNNSTIDTATVAATNFPSINSNVKTTPLIQCTTTTTTLSKTFAESLSLNNSIKNCNPSSPTSEQWPRESELPPAFPQLYLVDTDYEQLDNEPPKRPPNIIELLDENNNSSNSCKEDRIIFESSMDETFQKFADRMAQNPDQVIRYEFNGLPLLYSKHDKIGNLLSDGEKKVVGNSRILLKSDGIPKCENCGAMRVFELQLTPQAITELERDDSESTVNGMEWGTIFVGVCKMDCQRKRVLDGEVGYVEEWVGVQWEELK